MARRCCAANRHCRGTLPVRLPLGVVYAELAAVSCARPGRGVWVYGPAAGPLCTARPRVALASWAVQLRRQNAPDQSPMVCSRVRVRCSEVIRQLPSRFSYVSW